MVQGDALDSESLVEAMPGVAVAYYLIHGRQGSKEDAARRDFPHIQLLDYHTAVRTALSKLAPKHIEPAMYEGKHSVIIVKDESFFIDYRQTSLNLLPEVVYRAFTGLGGKRGWLYLNGLWKLRGWLERLLGGPGMRGRQDEDQLHQGATVDFYHVETLEPDRMLRLRSDLKAPGAGWMEWRVKPQAGGICCFCRSPIMPHKDLQVFFTGICYLPFIAWLTQVCSNTSPAEHTRSSVPVIQ
mgnify:CR=1 FL=1